MKLLQALRKTPTAAIHEFAQRFDSWRNEVTGFGTEIDKTTFTRFAGVDELSDPQLSNLYHGDDLAARMVDVVPDEMLREGFTVDCGDEDLNTDIAQLMEDIGADEALANGIRWGRLYGGGGVLLGADDGRSASQPLIPERAQALSYLHVLDRRDMWPLTYYTEPGPKFGRPETYSIAPTSTTQAYAVVHESRLVLFGGATTGERERVVRASWDYSILQRAYDSLRSFGTGWKAVEVLLTDGNQTIFKMSGLAEAISGQGEEELKKRLKVIDMFRSVLRALVIDAGDEAAGQPAEDFTRLSASFSEIPAVLDKFMLRLAAAVRIPVTILMGQSPAGMNATGESDFRWFYDQISSEQRRKLAPKIRRIVRVALATKAFAAKPDIKIGVEFPPLWSETPLARAQTRKAILDGDAVAQDKGFLLPEEIALHRFGSDDGFDTEIRLTPEGTDAREASLEDELERLESGEPDPADMPPIVVDPNNPPDPNAPPPAPGFPPKKPAAPPAVPPKKTPTPPAEP